jgi:glutamyl-tRNA reductase
MVRSASKRRGRRPLVIIDIAAPRDVDPEVGRLSGTFLYDLDALEGIVRQSLEQRAREVPRVERIVTEEVERFFEWYGSLAAAPIIGAMRRRFTEVALEEARRQAKHFADTDSEQVEKYTRSLLNKLLHHPTVQLRGLDPDTPGGLAMLDSVLRLFDLEPTAANGRDGSDEGDRGEDRTEERG